MALAPTKRFAGRKRDRHGRFIKKTATQSNSPNRLSLLGLPGELRNHIWRCAVVEERIELNGINGENRKQPSLLQVSRQIREEAKSIYYTENNFKFMVTDMAGERMVRFRKLMLRHRRGSGSTHNVGYGNFRYQLKGAINWANLLAWLKKYHESPELAPRFHRPRGNSTPKRTIASAAFDIVERMYDDRWDKVKDVLEAFHAVVKDRDSRWN